MNLYAPICRSRAPCQPSTSCAQCQGNIDFPIYQTTYRITCYEPCLQPKLGLEPLHLSSNAQMCSCQSPEIFGITMRLASSKLPLQCRTTSSSYWPMSRARLVTYILHCRFLLLWCTSNFSTSLIQEIRSKRKLKISEDQYKPGPEGLK